MAENSYKPPFVNIVDNSSNMRCVSPIVGNRCCLADLTGLPHNPPKCGTCGINRQSVV